MSDNTTEASSFSQHVSHYTEPTHSKLILSTLSQMQEVSTDCPLKFCFFLFALRNNVSMSLQLLLLNQTLLTRVLSLLVHVYC